MQTPATARKRNAGERRARHAAHWIGLAAAPTFALMAWVSAADASRIAICSSAGDLLPVDGMTAMYLLMSVFHLPIWLKLGARRPWGRT